MFILGSHVRQGIREVIHSVNRLGQTGHVTDLADDGLPLSYYIKFCFGRCSICSGFRSRGVARFCRKIDGYVGNEKNFDQNIGRCTTLLRV
jgi:hypothetical protein